MNFRLSIGFSLLSQILQSLSAVVASGLIVRTLSGNEIGFWFVLLAAMPFIGLLDLGLPVTITREIGFALGQDDSKNRVGKLVKTLLIFKLYIFLALPICVLVERCFLANHSFVEIVTYYLFVGGCLLRVYWNSCSAILVAVGRNNHDKAIKGLGSIVYLVSIFLILRKGDSSVDIAIAWLVQSIFLLGASMFMIFKAVACNSVSFQKEQLQILLAPSKEYILSALPSLGIFNLSVFFVSRFLGPTAVVELSLVQQISAVLMSVLTIPSSISSPILSYLFKSDISKFNEVLKRIYRFSSTSTAFALLFLLVTKPIWEKIWLGGKAHIGTSFIVLYFVLIFLEIQQVTLTTGIIASGFVRFSKVAISSVILIVLMFYLLLPKVGIIGVPVGIMVGQLLTCYWFSPWVSVGRFKWSLRALYRSHLLLLLVAPAAMLVFLISGQISLLSLSFLVSLVLFALMYYFAIRRDLFSDDFKSLGVLNAKI
ncbi:hypothetical protein [Bdellovibrio sp. HCB274]|uniref:hypothetical protein n=1 Tax=Bdellovibrio sp. HCB274 TaxID=3394361 RepID=UPI0039B5CAB7